MGIKYAWFDEQHAFEHEKLAAIREYLERHCKNGNLTLYPFYPYMTVRDEVKRLYPRPKPAAVSATWILPLAITEMCFD